jgi:hypothetical protein
MVKQITRLKLSWFAPLACGVLALLVFASSSDAFRPSSRWLLDQAAARQLSRQSKPLKIVSEDMFYDRADAPKGVSAQTKTWILPPDSIRVESQMEDRREVYVRNSNKEKKNKGTGQSSGIVKSKVRPHFVWDFLTMGKPLERRPAAEKLLKALEQYEINVDRVSYARFDGRVNYLIGSKAWETDKSQVWLDKETLLLTRLVLLKKTGEKTNETLDYRFLGWGSPEGGHWYPKIIEIWKDGKLERRSVTRQVDRVTALDRALFEVR